MKETLASDGASATVPAAFGVLQCPSLLMAGVRAASKKVFHHTSLQRHSRQRGLQALTQCFLKLTSNKAVHVGQDLCAANDCWQAPDQESFLCRSRVAASFPASCPQCGATEHPQSCETADSPLSHADHQSAVCRSMAASCLICSTGGSA